MLCLFWLFLERGPCDVYNAQMVRSGFKSAIRFIVSLAQSPPDELSLLGRVSLGEWEGQKSQNGVRNHVTEVLPPFCSIHKE